MYFEHLWLRDRPEYAQLTTHTIIDFLNFGRRCADLFVNLELVGVVSLTGWILDTFALLLHRPVISFLIDDFLAKFSHA